MSDFNLAIPVVLQREGGYSDNPNDNGGTTNFGISLRYLKTLGELGDIDGDGDIDADDIRALTKEKAIEIYKSQWWDKYGVGRINDQGMATKLFDCAVNMGFNQAVKLLQRACNRFKGISLVADGLLGNLTVNTINGLNAANLLACYRTQCVLFYQNLIAQNPKFEEFRNGWIKRANS